ncbi:hypothetical protein HYFRA_00005516 [Hymenoscyphus fraxineus]|uniref:Major facilitator superfamily (MFS) profile domain-containing protein n=1 Tax=Hymenoscyphus fraxineus TaxID=746836 RepID=A0A9N9KQT5_9HELO|nr:hypothetical protein HYFRA_00005516 [Hymenoscyphus fraxineus]
MSQEKLRFNVNHLELALTASSKDELARQGEELEELEKSYGVWESCKQNKLALFYILAAYSCAAAWGYDSIANTATLALPSFQRYFGVRMDETDSYYLESIWTSLWASMTGLGQVVGSVIAGPISQRIGRRYTAMGSGTVSVLGVTLQYLATQNGVLLAGKIINGAAVGGLLSIGTTYASEISPPRLRGILLGGMPYFAIVMQSIGLGVIRILVPNFSPISFRIALGLQWLVGGIPIIFFFFVPESPNYLLLRDRAPEARRAASRLYNPQTVPARIAHLENSIYTELPKARELSQASYLDCFRGTDLKRTLTVCLLMFGNGLNGSAFLTQNLYFLDIAGLPTIRGFDINIGGFALALVVIPLSWMFGDRIGSRTLYLIGVSGNIIGMAVVGGLGYVTDNKGVIWAVAVLLNLLISWQLVTSFMVSWTMAPELSSYRLRQPTQSIGICMQALTSWFFAFVTPYMYNIGPGSGNLGAKTGFVFAGTSILLGIMAWLWLPETRGLSTEELDRLYEERVSPREFGREVRRLRARGKMAGSVRSGEESVDGSAGGLRRLSSVGSGVGEVQPKGVC